MEEGTTSPFGNFAYTTNGDGEQVIYPDFIDLHSQQSPSAGTPDPLFVNYDFLADDLHNTEYNEAWDFHLQAGSPALGEGAYSGSDADMQPRFQTSGITVDGVKYTSPAPVARYGALGTK